MEPFQKRITQTIQRTSFFFFFLRVCISDDNYRQWPNISETKHQRTVKKMFTVYTEDKKNKINAVLTQLSLGWYNRRLCNLSPQDLKHLDRIEALINHIHSKKKKFDLVSQNGYLICPSKVNPSALGPVEPLYNSKTITIKGPSWKPLF